MTLFVVNLDSLLVKKQIKNHPRVERVVVK